MDDPVSSNLQFRPGDSIRTVPSSSVSSLDDLVSSLSNLTSPQSLSTLWKRRSSLNVLLIHLLGIFYISPMGLTKPLSSSTSPMTRLSACTLPLHHLWRVIENRCAVTTCNVGIQHSKVINVARFSILNDTIGANISHKFRRIFLKSDASCVR